MRDKSSQHIKPILEELIKTEETYVENLRLGLENYGNIFVRKDLPIGLRGKKYVLLGNIAQIYEFHAEEFLPMLHTYRRDLKRLFDEFQRYIEVSIKLVGNIKVFGSWALPEFKCVLNNLYIEI